MKKAKSNHLFWIAAVVALLLLLSIYYATKKLREHKGEEVVVIDVIEPTPPPGQTPTPKPEIPVLPNCQTNAAYIKYRKELGTIVNDHFLRKDPVKFAKTIEKYRLTHGLPLPMGISSNQLDAEGLVYDNCRPACNGMVHIVFISRIVNGRYAEVLMKDGKLKKVPLHSSGIEVLTVNEVAPNGIPFQFWYEPMDDGPWYIRGNYLYYPLDLEGLWLRNQAAGEWQVVPKDVDALKIIPREALKTPGCVEGERCLMIVGRSNRRYRTQEACAAVVKHAADEPVEEKKQ